MHTSITASCRTIRRCFPELQPFKTRLPLLKRLVRTITSAAVAATVAFFTTPTHAEITETAAGQWTVQSDFEGENARLDLSGAVCAGSGHEKQWCLAINDDELFAQFFSINGKTLTPTKIIQFLNKEDGTTKNKKIDAEAVAYFDGYIYVAASHGLSRKKGKFRPSQFFVFRFPVDKTTGKPSFDFDHENVPSQVQRTALLRYLIKSSPVLGSFAEQRLQDNGANLEGMAVTAQEVHFGFRAPSIDGNAFILTVKTESLFGQGKISPTVTKLKLGKRKGIRDLTPTSTGFLVLTGPSPSKEEGTANVFHWHPDTGQLVGYGTLPIKPSEKAETILLLEETETENGTVFKILVMFDSQKNGQPREFLLKPN